jgi:hypothetical protein
MENGRIKGRNHSIPEKSRRPKCFPYEPMDDLYKRQRIDEYELLALHFIDHNKF